MKQLASVAIQVSRLEQMVAFYSEAFGGEFKEVNANGMKSWFGVLAGVTFKMVPLREEVDFEGYPLLQLGFNVDDINDVIHVALKHGGQQEGEIHQGNRQVHGAVRDPDGNSIELYSKL